MLTKSDNLKPATTPMKWRGSLAVVKSAARRRYVEGYLIRYGSLDDQDLEDENFSKQTYFTMRRNGFIVKGKPLLYEHGLTGFGALEIGLFDFENE